MTSLPEKKAIDAFMDLKVASKREENSKINKGEVERTFEILESFAKRSPIALTQIVLYTSFSQKVYKCGRCLFYSGAG